MLQHIHIQNFAVVETLELNFQAGLCILTGETGAGKSIWIDALQLALGRRADHHLLRNPERALSVTLCFDITHNQVATHWLVKNALQDGNELIIRRVIQPKGTHRLTVNGIPCPLNLARELAPLILCLHSQHQQQILLKPEQQRLCLDQYANNSNLLIEINQIYSAYRKLEDRSTKLTAQINNREAELSLLRYQLDEFKTLAPQENEWQRLSTEHQKLHHAKSLITQLNQAIELTSDSDKPSASLLLQQAITELNTISANDSQIDSIKELLNTAAIHLQEAGDELNHYRNTLDLSPENLAHIEQRLTIIADLARKHHVSPDSLIDTQHSLEQKLADLENVDIELASLKQKQTKLITEYQTIATKLSASRVKAAKKLMQHMSASMQTLGMQGGEFIIELTAQKNPINIYGNEQIRFLVRTNPGQVAGPLAKIASGGELSRLSLALQLLALKQTGQPTIIFDEVDVGIGGQTANVVGQMLRALGKTTQVLCITHLAQVAACANHHYRVAKVSDKKQAQTGIILLTQEERVEELARMIGGAKITAKTHKHAEEMLQQIECV